MILNLRRQGLSPTAIARGLGIDRRTVRKYIAGGLEPPSYRRGPPRPRSIDAFLPYLREWLVAYQAPTVLLLWLELSERGFSCGYTAAKRAVHDLRPDGPRGSLRDTTGRAGAGRPGAIAPPGAVSKGQRPQGRCVPINVLEQGLAARRAKVRQISLLPRATTAKTNS
jgi:transposase